MAQHFAHVAQQPHRGQLEGPLEATAACSGEERPLDRRQVRPGAADLPQAFVEPQRPMQLGLASTRSCSLGKPVARCQLHRAC